MQDSLRGVNLGGWLVLERWMSPTLFKDTSARDESTFTDSLGAAEKLEAHPRSWISEEEFQWLADNGINAVRIPVGTGC